MVVGTTPLLIPVILRTAGDNLQKPLFYWFFMIFS